MKRFNLFSANSKIRYLALLTALIILGTNQVCRADDELTFDFGSSVTGWPTSSSAGNYSYTLSKTDYTFALGANVYCNSTYLMLKYTTSLGLPAISGKKLTKVVVTNSSGCSTSTRVGISSSSSSASYISGGDYQTYSTTSSDYTYDLTGTSDNTMYYLYITNKNCQITKIVLTYSGGCSGTKLGTPVVTPSMSSNKITLSWPNVANASSYTVTCSGGTVGSVTGTTTKSCQISSLTNGTEYTWTVKAIGNGSTYCDGDAAEGSSIPGTYYTVTFMNNGSSYTTKSIRSGTNLILPDNPSSCDAGKEFVGWATASINGSTNTKPTFVSTQTTISSAKTYYAVFATKTANSYSLGDVNDLIEGQKVLIVNQNAKYAMSNSGSSGSLTATSVTISSSKISSPASSLIWTVTLDGTKYKFKNTYYFYASSSSNTKLWCDDEDGEYPDSWTVTSAGSTGKYYLYSDNSTSSKKLEYYSTNTVFTTYTAGTDEKFKHSFFVPTYTNYVTTCCTALGAINGSFFCTTHLEHYTALTCLHLVNYIKYFKEHQGRFRVLPLCTIS